jgi:DNA-binding MarR family transcriptional regulator
LANSPKRKSGRTPGKTQALEADAWDLHEAMGELVRVYQFRDRTRICYYDLSVTQCYAVGARGARGPMTLNGLAAELYLDKSTTSRVVDSLEDKGYVRRAADPGDGRALRLDVTPKGQEIHSRIENDLVEEMKRLLDEFDPDVRQATTRLVARLARVARARFSKAGLRSGKD